MARPDETIGPGQFVVVDIGGEFHVLFEPDEIPHHFLSIARFQDRGRATSYAEVEESFHNDGEEPHGDVRAIRPIADPRQSAEPPTEAPVEVLTPPPAIVEPIPPPPKSDVAKVAAESMAAAKERALDHYAEHGGCQAEVAARTGVPLGSLSGFMSTARKDGDPRIAAGDAKRHPMPVAAKRAIEQAEKARATEPPKPPSDGRKLTHAEMVEAAKRAVPAPSFGDRKGVSCRTA